MRYIQSVPLRGERKCSAKCYAKINLGLRVLGLRADRFHELRTIYQTVSLYDTLICARTPGTGIQFDCDIAEISGPGNLVVRAAAMMAAELRLSGGLRIELRKRIPMGAGLGGGSSDAAAALRAVCRLTGRSPSPKRLLEIAASLGSDVPFFLLGGAALGVGRGTEVYELPDVSRQWMVLAYPGVHVDTARAYRDLDAASSLTETPETDKIHSFCASSWDVRGARPELVNDFEPVVLASYPQIARLKKFLVRAGVSAASMSGSGSAVYGLCGGKQQAEAIGRRVSKRFPDCRVWVVRTVGRGEAQKT